MKQSFPLGGYDENYNSKIGRAQAINCHLEFNNKGTFSRVRRVAGETQAYSVGAGPTRGQFEIQGELFVVSGSKLHKIDSSEVITELGDVGGSNSKVHIAANGADDNQIMVVSDGNGYIYDPSLGTPFQQIVDGDFSVGNGLASLNQIFWVPKPDSTSFIGSDNADGLNWTATRIASAEQNPDVVYQPVSLKGAIWWMGAKTCEYWTFNSASTTVPIRPVVGSTIPRGVGAPDSIASFQDNIFWLADDFTVWQIRGNSASKISDINLEYAIKGDGRQAPYSNPEIATGFFIDHPVHKMYVLTFPNDNATWIYNLSTGYWNRRESESIGRWRGNTSSIFKGKVLVGDYNTGTLWELSENVFKEGDDVLKYQLIPPAIFSPTKDLFVGSIELLMEVGVGNISAIDGLGILKDKPIDPKMVIEFSVDGGIRWNLYAGENVSLGRVGDRGVKVIVRKQHRIRQSHSLMIRITVTDDVPVDIYDMSLDIEEGM